MNDKEWIIDDDELDFATKQSAEARGCLDELVRCKNCKYAVVDELTFPNDPRMRSVRCRNDIKDHGSDIHSAYWFCYDGEVS